MPTSDPGSSEARGSLRRTRGFTLIEMLAVVVLAGIVVAMVTISAAPNPRRELRMQAEQLGQLFIAAQDEAFLTGRPVVWEVDAHGFHFSERKDDRWDAPQNELLRPRAWSVPITRIAMNGDRAPRLVFTREMATGPVALTLQQDAASVVLRGDGVGRYTVDE